MSKQKSNELKFHSQNCSCHHKDGRKMTYTAHHAEQNRCKNKKIHVQFVQPRNNNYEDAENDSVFEDELSFEETFSKASFQWESASTICILITVSILAILLIIAGLTLMHHFNRSKEKKQREEIVLQAVKDVRSLFGSIQSNLSTHDTCQELFNNSCTPNDVNLFRVLQGRNLARAKTLIKELDPYEYDNARLRSVFHKVRQFYRSCADNKPNSVHLLRSLSCFDPFQPHPRYNCTRVTGRPDTRVAGVVDGTNPFAWDFFYYKYSGQLRFFHLHYTDTGFTKLEPVYNLTGGNYIMHLRRSYTLYARSKGQSDRNTQDDIHSMETAAYHFSQGLRRDRAPNQLFVSKGSELVSQAIPSHMQGEFLLDTDEQRHRFMNVLQNGFLNQRGFLLYLFSAFIEDMLHRVGSAQDQEENHDFCQETTVRLFDRAVLRMFEHWHSASKVTTLDLHKVFYALKQEIRHFIHDGNWLPEKEEKSLLIKIDSLKLSVGNFIDYPWKDSELTRFYQDLTLDSNFLSNYQQVHSYRWENAVRLGPVRDLDTVVENWSSASYDAIKNEFLLPVGLLQTPFFNPDYPTVLNHGLINLAIAKKLAQIVIKWFTQDPLDINMKGNQAVSDIYNSVTANQRISSQSFRKLISRFACILQNNNQHSANRTQTQSETNNLISEYLGLKVAHHLLHSDHLRTLGKDDEKEMWFGQEWTAVKTFFRAAIKFFCPTTGGESAHSSTTSVVMRYEPFLSAFECHLDNNDTKTCD